MIRRFILFHGKRHPSSMGAEEVNVFLSHLAVERTVSASTQNQALAALLAWRWKDHTEYTAWIGKALPALSCGQSIGLESPDKEIT